MSSFTIKLIAIITMAIDHLGLFFFPQILLFRVIGRVSFPLFAWLVASGAFHTKNSLAYAKRLLILAIIAQFPYLYVNRLINPLFNDLNAVFTLFLGLVAIIFVLKTKNKFYWLLAIIIASFLSILFRTDYGVLGILMIVFSYLFYNNLTKLALTQVVLLFVMPYLTLIIENIYQVGLSRYYFDSYYEFFGIISMFIIAMYNKKQGFKEKYLFYYFYPLQYVVIILFKFYL